jgi:oligoendopeptidase F
MTERDLPHWDVTVVYPSLESKEFEQGFHQAAEAIRDLCALFDQEGIKHRKEISLDNEPILSFEKVITRLNEVLMTVRTTYAYVRSFITTDSRNDLAQAKWSILQQELVHLTVLETRFTAWIGALDVEELIQRSQIARDHAYMLRKAKLRSDHLMTPKEEALAAELSLTGGDAWEKLHGDFSSQLMVEVEIEGEHKTLPMSAVRNLAFSPNRDVRRKVYEAELAAWERAAVPIAAALNSIKGEINTLTRRRKWRSALELALFQNNIEGETLNVMMTTAREFFPDFRRYLLAKAKALELPILAWYDLSAPVGSEGRAWPFREAQSFIIKHFCSYSDKLSHLAERAFAERWIDAEPRFGKNDGAFCMFLRGDESRILANYQPSFDGMSTIAHELGHAYHNLALAKRTFLQRNTPMTLAETASIFCQTIVRIAALKEADAEDQLLILEAWLQDACQVVLDISSRFIFEEAVFDKRIERELSVAELNELMLDAQKQTYGNGLDEGLLHPYMWAVKPHYYQTDLSFYNFPYMFGLLFGLGLYAHYQKAPEEFLASYDELLSSTGMGDAAEMAARFGIELRESHFWRSSLEVIRADIDQFEALIMDRMPKAKPSG